MLRALCACVVVAVLATNCFGNELIFSFDGESRDGRLVSGLFKLSPGEELLTMEIDNGEGEGMGINPILNFNTIFSLVEEVSSPEQDIVLLNHFVGNVGGSVSLVGIDIASTTVLSEETIPTIINGVITVWDDAADFNLTAQISNWKTESVQVPEPSAVVAGTFGFLSLLIGSSYLIRH